jgi:hypothetical protein
MAQKQIVHRVSAGNNFNGATPSGPPVQAGNKDTFPLQAGGGKFDIGGANVKAEGLILALDGVAEWKLELIDASDELIREIGRTPDDDEGDPVTTLTSSITCGIDVAAGEKLKLTTTNATGEITSELLYDDGQ